MRHGDTIAALRSQSAIEKFWEYCGITAQQRRYGQFEISGKVVNFYYNRFLKNLSSSENEHNDSKEQDANASTREAFYVGYDKNTTSRNQRDDAIANRLPDGKDTRFRAKKIKYGNFNAMWEVLSGHLYQLTGLEAPDTRMMICGQYNANEIPDIYVASPLITGYYDLGDFLVDEKIISSFISTENLEIWQKEKDKIDAINFKSKSAEGISGNDKLARIKSLSVIYELLPDYVHEEIEKSFAASKFIANWDFANFNLNNIGVKFTFDKDRNVVSFNSVFVDFGNSGFIGFGGQKKDQSLERANTEAKKYQEGSKDYDPALKLNEAELDLIARYEAKINPQNINPNIANHRRNLAILAISKELSDQESQGHPLLGQSEIDFRRNIIFKTAHQILPQESSLRIDSLSGFLTVSDLPRNLPFGILLKPALKTKTTRTIHNIKSTVFKAEVIESEPAEFQGLIQNLTPLKDPFGLADSIFLDSEIEMAFRLSLIPDSAIEHVVKEWYLYDEFPEIFPGNNPAVQHETATQVADIFKQRRDDLIALIPTEVVDKWVQNNKCKALAAQEEVILAISKETHSPDANFETKYPFAETGGGDSSRSKISASSPARKLASKSSLASQSDFSLISLTESPSSDEFQNYGDSEIRIDAINNHNSFDSRIARSPTNNGNNKNAGSNSSLIIAQINDFQPQENPLTKIAISTLESSLALVSSNKDKEILSVMIREKKTEQEQFRKSETINFIYENLEVWKKDFDLKPNCSFLNLDLKREIYRTRNNDDLSVPSDQFLFSKDNFERNTKLHNENCFVYSSFMDNLKSAVNDRTSAMTNSINPTASLPLSSSFGNTIYR